MNAFAHIVSLDDEALANYLHFEMVNSMLESASSDIYKDYITSLYLSVNIVLPESFWALGCLTTVKNKFSIVLDYLYARNAMDTGSPETNFQEVEPNS